MGIFTLPGRKSRCLWLSVPGTNEPRAYFVEFKPSLFFLSLSQIRPSTILFKWLWNCIIRSYFKEICHSFCEAFHGFYYSGVFWKARLLSLRFLCFSSPEKGKWLQFSQHQIMEESAGWVNLTFTESKVNTLWLSAVIAFLSLSTGGCQLSCWKQSKWTMKQHCKVCTCSLGVVRGRSYSSRHPGRFQVRSSGLGFCTAAKGSLARGRMEVKRVGSEIGQKCWPIIKNLHL